MTIAKVISGRVHSIVKCSPESSVRDVARMLADNRIGALPVVDGQSVVGIFSERDLLYCVAQDSAMALLKEVGLVMTSPAITVGPEASVLEALSLMTKRRIRHLPVVENDRMIAFVSIGDLVKYRIDAIENEAQAMRDYITAA